MRSILQTTRAQACRGLKGSRLSQYPSCYVNNMTFSSTSGNDGATPDRGEATKGAMRDYLNQQTGGGFFAQLRSNLSEQYDQGDRKKRQFNRAEGGSNQRFRNNNKRKVYKDQPKDSSTQSQPRTRSANQEAPKSYQDTEFDMVAPLLYDIDDIEKLVVGKGMSLNHDRFDDADAFFGEMLVEALKTSSHTYEEYFPEKDKNGRKRTINSMPRPRSVFQLQSALQPKGLIGSEQHGLNAEMQDVVEQAWHVLNKNYYYSSEQKLAMTNGMVSTLSDIQKYIEEVEKKLETADNEDEVLEGSLKSTFRVGLQYMLKEEQEELLRGAGGKKKQYAIEKGETDWSVEAVEDEDDF